MSKFSSVVDSLHWDSNSCNEISLRLVNGCQEGISSNNGWELSKIIGPFGEEEENMELESKTCTPNSNLQLNVCISAEKSESVIAGMKSKTKSGDKLPIQRHGGEMRQNALDLACVSPSNDHLEDRCSNPGSIVRSTPTGSKVHPSKQKESYKYKRDTWVSR